MPLFKIINNTMICSYIWEDLDVANKCASVQMYIEYIAKAYFHSSIVIKSNGGTDVWFLGFSVVVKSSTTTRPINPKINYLVEDGSENHPQVIKLWSNCWQ